MSYRALDNEFAIPRPGVMDAYAREKQDLDFKVFADPKRTVEHAKDIAAFANSLGGTLLVGAKLKDVVLSYPGVKGQTAAEVKELYEDAAGLCDPPMVVDVTPIHLRDGAVVVAVNVAPFAMSVVAAPGAYKPPKPKGEAEGRAEDEDREVPVANSWRYPVRRASQTQFLSPKEIPMYMNPDARRAYVLLDAIPHEVRKLITLHYATPRKRDQVAHTQAVFVDADLERNRAIFMEGQAIIGVPLREVLEVWENSHDRWSVRIKGAIDRTIGGAGPRYLPIP